MLLQNYDIEYKIIIKEILFLDTKYIYTQAHWRLTHSLTNSVTLVFVYNKLITTSFFYRNLCDQKTVLS